MNAWEIGEQSAHKPLGKFGSALVEHVRIERVTTFPVKLSDDFPNLGKGSDMKLIERSYLPWASVTFDGVRAVYEASSLVSDEMLDSLDVPPLDGAIIADISIRPDGLLEALIVADGILPDSELIRTRIEAALGQSADDVERRMA